MTAALKDFVVVIISISSLCLNVYRFWDSRRRKIRIYFQTNIDLKDDVLMHFLTFSIINKNTSAVHIFDTRFYLYENRRKGLISNFWNRIFSKPTRVYFGSTLGHICDQLLYQDELREISIEAYEIFSNYSMKGKQVEAIKIELIDVDGNKHTKKILLNQLEHHENKAKRSRKFCYPLRFHKEETKRRKKKEKELKNLRRLQEKSV